MSKLQNRTFRFLFGDDARVVGLLLIVGGGALALRAFVIFMMLGMGDPSPTGDDPSLFELLPEMLFEIFYTWSTVFFVIGLAGWWKRRSDPSDVRPSGRQGLVDVRLSLWLIIVGIPWLIAPTRLIWTSIGSGMGVERDWEGQLSEAESIINDVLLPVLSANIVNPGLWLLGAGLLGFLVSIGRKAMGR